MTVLFVEYPKCSTCKKAKSWLDEHGVEYVDRDIVTDNPTADELATWIARSGLPVRRFFNSSGMKYRELGLKARLDAGMTDQECYELLATDAANDGDKREATRLTVRARDLVGEEACAAIIKLVRESDAELNAERKAKREAANKNADGAEEAGDAQ